MVSLGRFQWVAGMDGRDRGHTCCVFASRDLDELLDVFYFGGHGGEWNGKGMKGYGGELGG